MKNTHKVLHLRSSGGVFGAENVILQLAKQLSRSQYQPIIGVFKNSQNIHTELADVAKRNGFDAEIFACQGRIDFRTIRAIRNFILENQINIVHCHGYKADLYGLMSTLFMNGKVRLVATCCPWVHVAYERLDKLCLKRFDSIVTESEEIRKEVIDSGIPPSKIMVIQNGVDVEGFDFPDVAAIREEFQLGPDVKVIGTIARLSEEKGHDVLLEAVRMLVEESYNVFFLIVGGGPLRQKLQQKAEEMNLDKHVQFTGIYPDIQRILALLDIFVLPSYSEGLPMALLEAMAAKKAVVATRVGTIPRIIEHNKSGILISPGRADELKQAVTDILQVSTKATELGENAHAKIVNEYSSQQMGKRYVEIYNDLIP